MARWLAVALLALVTVASAQLKDPKPPEEDYVVLVMTHEEAAQLVKILRSCSWTRIDYR